MPTFLPNEPPPSVLPRLTRNTVSLVTLATSIAPLNGIVSSGCGLKPSSVFRTSMSSQVTGCAWQSGFGRCTRWNVFWVKSITAKRSLGNSVRCGSR